MKANCWNGIQSGEVDRGYFIRRRKGRKVTLDKDFKSMQLVGRKKEDYGLNILNSEKENSREVDEKMLKLMSIEEFQRVNMEITVMFVVMAMVVGNLALGY